MERNPNSDGIICCKCNKQLILKTVKFKYLNFVFSEELYCCPLCNQVHITEEFVNGRMREVEVSLEDK